MPMKNSSDTIANRTRYFPTFRAVPQTSAPPRASNFTNFTCTMLKYIGCPTTYQTRQFFNNSKTNEDIATRFEQEYVRCERNEKECVCRKIMSVCVCSKIMSVCVCSKIMSVCVCSKIMSVCV